MGIKLFTNDTGYTLRVYLFVRAGSNPGCVRRRVGFDLIANETKSISYGSESDPFLDGILAYQNNDDQYSCTKMCVNTRGGRVDTLLNTNSLITFSIIKSSIVISGSNSNNICR